MSGFVKRNTNTVNPAGGVNPASSPNVGQYGWTSYDAGNVNQLIEYVNICKTFAESAKNSADYVQSRFDELQGFMNYITEAYEKVSPIVDNIEIIYKDILLKHKEVTSMHKDVTDTLARVLVSEGNAAASATEAANSAAMSEASAVASEASKVQSGVYAMEARDIAEELRKGQVYRGTWNVEANNGYPAAPDTNSVWDVTLNEGSASFRTPDNILWFWGDRLLYLKDDNAFSQIESGSGVLSVNGKSGAVTLVASDVGAVDKTSDTMTGALFWSDNNKYVNGSGNNMYVAAKSGRVYIEGSSTPIARVGGIDHNMYHQGFKPTAADVGAVGNTGNQTLAGELRATKFLASDAYAYVSSNRPFQGLFMGTSDNTSGRRTIIGGGGSDVGDGLGTVVIRANGITDNAGEITFQPTGNITAPVAPTAATHLANKGYVDGQVKTVDDKIAAATTLAQSAMPKSGGTFTGPVVLKEGVPGAIKVNNQASISYQNGGGTVFHSYAADNSNMAWSQGDGKENRLMTLRSDGLLTVANIIYGTTGIASKNRADTTLISIETPEDAAPYIATQAPDEAHPTVALRFGSSEILAENSKTLAASSVRVGNDGGLKFAPSGDLSGMTYGMGINPTTRSVGLYQYNNGAYAGAVWDVDNARNTHFHTGLSVQGSFLCRGGSESTYHQVRNNGNPTIELHQPGVSAVMMYCPQNTRTVRFAQSNGAGGESVGYGGIDSDGMFTASGRFRAIYQAANRGWTAVGSTPFYAEGISVGDGSFRSIVGGYSVIPSQWSLESTYGVYTVNNPEDTAHVLHMTDGGGFNRFWRFTNGGTLFSPTNWSMVQDGTLIGTVFGGYSSMINWCTGSFAPISDERLKRNIKPATKSALQDIAQIQFKSYEWNTDAKVANMNPTKIGLVAQEMEEIDPAYTRDIQTFNVDGSVDTSVKGLDVTNMLALALKAIQEQQEQINELKEKLNGYVQH